MKRLEAINLLEELKRLKDVELESRTAISIIKNIKKLEEANKPYISSKKFMEFEKERTEKIQPFLVKKPDGTNKIENGKAEVDPAKQEEWQKVFDELTEKHKKALDTEQTLRNEYLTKDVDVKIEKIRLPKTLTLSLAQTLIKLT
jgi:hypothetical protein